MKERYSKNSRVANKEDRFIPIREVNNFYNPVDELELVQGSRKKRMPSDSICSKRRNTFRYSKRKENRSIFSKEMCFNIESSKKGYKINKNPVKVIEAPGLLDDFYLNLLSWGRNNIVSVGLEESVFLFNFRNNEVINHLSLSSRKSADEINSINDIDKYVCGTLFDELGDILYTGDSIGNLYLSNVEKNKVVSSRSVHGSRIGSLDAHNNLLITGSRDKMIKLFDIRSSSLSPINCFSGHSQEICGIKLSSDSHYIASGGNDNKLILWDIRKMKQVAQLGDHEAAVKALAWNPNNKNILLSGAGTADRKIRIFDCNSLEQINEIDTGSQVCNLAFDNSGPGIISTQGYSLNQLIVWIPNDDYSEIYKEDLLIAHKLRVLYMSQSPCGKYIATGAGDETIRIWGLENRQKKVETSSFYRKEQLSQMIR